MGWCVGNFLGERLLIVHLTYASHDAVPKVQMVEVCVSGRNSKSQINPLNMNHAISFIEGMSHLVVALFVLAHMVKVFWAILFR